MSPSHLSLACPTCGTILRSKGDSLDCPSCGRSYPIKGGIPCFLDPDYYWGELDEAELASLNDLAEEIGWREAIGQRLTEPRWRWQSVADATRTHWAYLLDLDGTERVLDVGCGMGQHTTFLARRCGEVHGIDAVWQRLRFTGIRARQEGLDNVHLALASVFEPPFPVGSFDLIVLVGIVEWLGEWHREGGPRDVQVMVLRKLRQLLAPGGRVVVGIENRYGYNMFLGALDHNGLRFTSLMPRPLADVVNRRLASGTYRSRRGDEEPKPYRTYTYSKAGYRRLMDDAGFREPSFFLPVPGYNWPVRLLPLGRGGDPAKALGASGPGLKRRIRSLGAAALSKAGLLEHLVPHYLFVASKDSDFEPVYRLPGHGEAFELGSSYFSPGTGRCTQLLEGVSTKTRLVRKFAADPDAEAGLVREHGLLRALAEHRRDLVDVVRFPEPIHLGEGLSIETMVSGEPLAGVVSRGDVVWGEARELARWLARLHRALHAALGERWQHGDVSPRNLVREPGRPLGLFDWEAASPELPGLYDVVTLVSSMLKMARPEGWSEAVARCWAWPGHPGLDAAEVIRVYAGEVGMDQASIPQEVLAALEARLERERARDATGRFVPGYFSKPWERIVEAARKDPFPSWGQLR